MSLVPSISVGEIHAHIEWIIGVSTPVTIHYRWLGHYIISISIFVVIFLLIPLILFLVQRFNRLIQGSYFLVSCLHYLIQGIFSLGKVGKFLMKFSELCGDFLILVVSECLNFPCHNIVDLVLDIFLELVVFHDKMCFEMGPCFMSCCHVV